MQPHIKHFNYTLFTYNKTEVGKQKNNLYNKNAYFIINLSIGIVYIIF